MKYSHPLPAAVTDFLGSVRGLASSVEDVVEKELLRSVVGQHVNPSQLKLLKLVSLTDLRTIRDVAAFFGISDAAASKAVDKVVQRGLLRRVEGEADRRAVRLLLTKTGHRLLAAYDVAKRRKLAKAFGGLTDAELRFTAQFLDRLSAGILDNTTKPEETCTQCGIYFKEQCLVRQLVARRCFYDLHKAHRNMRLPARPQDATVGSVRENYSSADRTAPNTVPLETSVNGI